ncbi:MAG TPA: hypothetical protein VMA30_21895 [Xanthobacteraceae bacterium]|nr:hypothetical protein [Xanthobacteraceae bacterium]
MPAATAIPAPLREAVTSHPNIAAFVDLNHGNFKPRAPYLLLDWTGQNFAGCG